jgi:hypothetical protein
LLIALCALVVSTLTAAAVIYQGRLLSSQLSVSVWPYVAFQTTVSETTIELDIQNVGAGPALVRGAVLLIDGKVQPSLTAGLHELGYHYVRGDDVTLSSIGPGEVLRAAETVAIAHQIACVRAKSRGSAKARAPARLLLLDPRRLLAGTERSRIAHRGQVVRRSRAGRDRTVAVQIILRK